MRIAVHGASGRLGRLIMEEAGNSAVAIGRGEAVPECDVVIDVTSAAGLAVLLPRLSGQPLVIGTTGDLPEAALAEYAQGTAVAIVPNFSAGVPMLIDLIRAAVAAMPEDWEVEIVEAHHNQKKDAPSGTSRRLARAVVEAGGEQPEQHSLRLGDTVGEHTVWLSGPGERLELKHVATRRAVFAIGALRWAKRIRDLPPGLHRP
ncbi:MAG: 4-hydroxy-tetrahydrodipicolinate reductase [Myxococcota bacterium]|jgi:4-hydroxy-tetrahydrodipicolinate reductase